MTSTIQTWGIAIVGGVVGATVGYFAFMWLIRNGLEAAVLPGALTGLGAGYFLKQRNVVIGLMSGVLALAIGIFTQLQAFTFGDGSLAFFLTHPQPATWLMLGLGGAFGFWFGVGRNKEPPEG